MKSVARLTPALLTVLMAALALFSQPGCSSVVEPLTFSVTPSSLTLSRSETAQLQVTVLDGNGEPVTGRSVAYQSQNPGIATVSTTGLVTAVSLGTTSIYLTAKGVSGAVPVTVIPITSGSWTGTTQIENMAVTFTMTLVETAAGNVSGTGSFTIDGYGLLFTITGTHTHPTVRLTISAANVQPAHFVGQFTGADRIAGQLFDSGFTGESLALLRLGATSENVALSDSYLGTWDPGVDFAGLLSRLATQR